MSIRAILPLIMLALATPGRAQCAFHNEAFGGGEFLTYNLYFNWKFVWVKAGNASMSTVESSYRGQRAYRASLTTRSSDRVDKVFVMRDTLLCYVSRQLEPLYFRKGAREGKRYTVDEVAYGYSGGKARLRQHRRMNNGEHARCERELAYCVYDMLSLFLRARSFNPDGWRGGHVVDVPIADGNSVTPARLSFDKRVNIKADNGVRYRCLKLAYMEQEGGKYRRIVDFYVTDDKNHVPVRLDMFLRFGSAKAFLVGMKGVRSPVASVVK